MKYLCAIALFLALTGCEPPPPGTGAVDGRCRPDGTCQGALVCLYYPQSATCWCEPAGVKP